MSSRSSGGYLSNLKPSLTTEPASATTTTATATAATAAVPPSPPTQPAVTSAATSGSLGSFAPTKSGVKNVSPNPFGGYLSNLKPSLTTEPKAATAVPPTQPAVTSAAISGSLGSFAPTKPGVKNVSPNPFGGYLSNLKPSMTTESTSAAATTTATDVPPSLPTQPAVSSVATVSEANVLLNAY
jgi:hypothetical protein